MNYKTCLRCAMLRNYVSDWLRGQDCWDGGVPFEGLADELDNANNDSPEWQALWDRWNEIKLQNQIV